MNYNINTNKIATSTFIQEEYFPVIIEFSDEELNNCFIEFKYEDTDLFEFVVDKDTHLLKRFCLTLCNHYSIEHKSLDIPKGKDGLLYITGTTSFECELFQLTVYYDGLQIKISQETPHHYIKSGQIILGLSEAGSLSSVSITSLTKSEVAHVISELKH